MSLYTTLNDWLRNVCQSCLQEVSPLPLLTPVHNHMYGWARRGTLLATPAPISQVYEQLHKKGAVVTGCSRKKDQIGYDSPQ
jgi:hypothetical protein